jgi:5-oxoprolinase (ATP-hydrolysing)
VLYQDVIEIRERVTLEDFAEHPDRLTTDVKAQKDPNLILGLSGEAVRILERPDPKDIKQKLQNLYDDGYRSIAVCLLHSYTFPDHEKLVGEIAEDIGFTHISLSSQLMPMIKLVPRATSATADAYLTPEIRRYVAGFEKGFMGGLGAANVLEKGTGSAARCEFMQRYISTAPMDEYEC